MDNPQIPFPVTNDPSSSENQLIEMEAMQSSAHETESSRMTSSDKLSALPTLPADPKNPQRWGFQRNYPHSLDAATSFPSYALDELESIRNEAPWGPSSSQSRREGGGRAAPTSFRAPGSGDSSPGPGRDTPKQRISFDSDRGSHATPKRVGQTFAKLVGGRSSNPSASPNPPPQRSPSPRSHPRNHRASSPLRMLHQWSSGMGRSHRHAREEPFVPVNPFKMRRRKKKFTLSGILSPPPSPDVEGGGSLGSSSSGVYDCEDVIPITSIKAALDEVRVLVTDTLPRQLYLNMLLRLPSMYFGRVARIFEDAEVSRPEIQRMIDVMCNKDGESQEVSRQRQEDQGLSTTQRTNTVYQSRPTSPTSTPAGPIVDMPLPFPDEWTPTSVSPSLFRFKHSWEAFIDSLIREWKTLNIVSALLSSAILSIFQVPEAAEDPVTRTLALLSLVSALMSLSYGCMYIIRFQTMRSMFRASRWAEQAQKTKTLIWWNVWVMLAMPVVWMSWAMVFFLSSIMSFVWRTGSEDDPEARPPLSRKAALGPRIAITAVLAIGIIYLFMIIKTLRRYGSGQHGLQGLLRIGHEGGANRPTTTPAEGSSAAGRGFDLTRIRTPESDASDQRGRKRQRMEVYEHFQSQRSKSSRRKGSGEKVEIEKEEVAVVSVSLQDRSADSL